MNEICSYIALVIVLTLCCAIALLAWTTGRRIIAILSVFLGTSFSISPNPPSLSFLLSRIEWSITAYWLICLCVGIPLIPSPEQSSRKSIVLVRKCFHLLAVVMFTPVILQGPDSLDFVAMAGITVLGIMMILECLRVSKISRFVSLVLTRLMKPVLDRKDTGSSVVTSHIQLLLACVGPTILFAVQKSADLKEPISPHVRLLLLSGLITVGIGDSAAALVGLSVPRPHAVTVSGKSIEGFLAFVGSVMTACVLAGSEMSSAVVIATIVAGVTELYIADWDNVALPVVFSAILVALSEV